jgi:hypothetical protein
MALAFPKLPRIRKQGKLFEEFLSKLRKNRPVRSCFGGGQPASAVSVVLISIYSAIV